MAVKLGATNTYVYQDYDTTNRRPIAPFVPVVIFNTLQANTGQTIVRPPDPASDYTNLSTGDLWTVTKRAVVGVTQGWAKDNEPVVVQCDGITRVIVTDTVNPGDVVYIGVKTANATDRVQYVSVETNDLFKNMPELRPLVHPLYGKQFSFVVPSVMAISPASMPTYATGLNVMLFPIGVALKGAAGTLTQPRIVPVHLNLAQQLLKT